MKISQSNFAFLAQLGPLREYLTKEVSNDLDHAYGIENSRKLVRVLTSTRKNKQVIKP